MRKYLVQALALMVLCHVSLSAAAAQGMIVLVGCLYWGNSEAKADLQHWSQQEAKLVRTGETVSTQNFQRKNS